MITEIKNKSFSNGIVYALKTRDGYPIETTDTFLPYYTKFCINEHTNELKEHKLGSRKERWMIGVSVMSGCPVRCRFCATGKLKQWRNLTADEIVAQVEFILNKNKDFNPLEAQEFKINYTRMGEPFLNIEEVVKAIQILNNKFKNIHHYISTVGITNSDFNFISDNITLQLSLHAMNDEKRDWLIPYKNKLSIEDLGKIRTKSNLKTTINLTLVDEKDFDINVLQQYFDKECFFIKLSPINPNEISNNNKLGKGIIESKNIL